MEETIFKLKNTKYIKTFQEDIIDKKFIMLTDYAHAKTKSLEVLNNQNAKKHKNTAITRMNKDFRRSFEFSHMLL